MGRSRGAAKTKRASAPPVEPVLAVDRDGWLVEVVGRHTCSIEPGSGAEHEENCGTIPVATIQDVLDGLDLLAQKRSAEEDAKAASTDGEDLE